jgi:hypothetical protein
MLKTAPNELDSEGAFFLDRTTNPDLSVVALGRPFLAVPLSCPLIAVSCARDGSGYRGSGGRMEELLRDGKIRRANGAWMRSVANHRPWQCRDVGGNEGDM